MELSILFILWLDKKVLFQQMLYMQKMANCLALASLIMTAMIYFGHYVKKLSLHKIYLVTSITPRMRACTTSRPIRCRMSFSA